MGRARRYAIWTSGLLILWLIYSQQPIGNSLAVSPFATPIQLPANLAVVLSNHTTTDLYTLDIGSGHLHLVARDTAANGLAYSPDHKHIAIAQNFGDKDVQIVLMNADGSNRNPIYAITTVSHNSGVGLPWNQLLINQILWSPDGTRLAFDLRDLGDSSSSQLDIISTEGQL